MPNVTEKYISFVEFPNPGKKTKMWQVRSTNSGGMFVGRIQWWGAWRKYVLLPFDGTVYDWGCMRMIAEFCERKTREHPNYQYDKDGV